MRFWTAYALVAFGITQAHGAEGGTSLSDLIAPAVNLTILFSLLTWKLKTPLRNFFNKKAEDVQNTIERADIKSKDAQEMLAREEKRAANLDSELNAIRELANQDVQNFEKALSLETEDKTQKLKADASMKIEANKKAMMDALSNELLVQVISKTKTTIKSNKDYQNKVSTKLLQGL